MYNRYAIDNTIFNIAIYIRLSREDGDDLESESVTNQRSLLIGYLKAQNLVAVDIYVDDGYTGTNFERPEFKRMLSDIENGKINRNRIHSKAFIIPRVLHASAKSGRRKKILPTYNGTFYWRCTHIVDFEPWTRF